MVFSLDRLALPPHSDSPPVDWWRRDPLVDRLALALLVLIPTLWFGIPALLGRAILTGDNFYQNFPLRVFTGRLLREGHLPLWNAYQWGGTALLGGFNAGALFPGTWLFAFLSPLLAWAINCISAFALGGTGMYLLLRSQRIAPLAALLGSMTFTYAGFMPAQFVHCALTQGMALVPWMLLAIERLGTQREGRFGYFVLLCASGGAVIYSGEPRSISSAAFAAAIFAIGVWIKSPLRRQLTLFVGSALPVTVALGALQLLVGVPFVHASQRGNVEYGYFAQGGWEPLPRLISPFFKTSHSTWNYPYWDTEVWGYVGLLPIIALFTFPFWRRFSRGRPGVWVALTLIGLLLSLGGHTPLGQLLYDLPLYGGQRGQSRNLALVDFGLAALAACWVDDWLTRRSVNRSRGLTVTYWVLSVFPSIAMIGIVINAHRLIGHHSAFGVPFRQFLIPLTLVVSASYVLFLWLSQLPRIPDSVRLLMLAALITNDLGFAFAHLEFPAPLVEPLLQGSEATDNIASLTGHYGRFAYVDPSIALHDTISAQLTPDVFLLLNLRSVQGLGSVVDASYDADTDGHSWRHFSADALEGDPADDLNLRLVILPTHGSLGHPKKNDRAAKEVLIAPHWVEGKEWENYRPYLNAQAKGRAWLEPRTQESEDGDLADAPPEPPSLGEVQVQHVDSQDAETDAVTTAAPAMLVRSVAYGDGWFAAIRRADGTTIQQPVQRWRTVQAVELPGGPVTVTWTYDPPGAHLGLQLTVAALLLLGGISLALIAQRVLAWRGAPARHTGEIANA